jgi:adhesin transport system outer membrane protein
MCLPCLWCVPVAALGPEGATPTSSSAWGYFKPSGVDPAGPIAAGAAAQAVQAARSPVPAPAPPGAAQAALGPELDLLAAVRIAVGWQPVIGAAVAELARRGGTIEVARAGYMPALRGGVDLGRQSDSVRRPLASLSLSQMLYDFGKVGSQVGEAEAGVRQAQADVLQQIDAIATQTALAVVELDRYQALVAIAEDQVRALGEVVRITDLRAQLGASTRVDPVQARARVQSAQVYSLQLRSQAQQWRARLIALLGTDLPERVAPLPEQQLAAATRPGAAPVWPTVLAAEAERQASLARLDGARAARLPTVSLEASANRYLGGSGNPLVRGGDHGVYFRLSSPMLQGGAMAAQEQAAAQAVIGAEARVQAKRIETQDKLKGLEERIAGLNALRQPLQERQSSITETRALYREQYLALGTRSALDLLNAEQEIAQAAFDVVQNRHDLWTAQINHIEANGRAREAFGINHSRVQGVEVLP